MHRPPTRKPPRSPREFPRETRVDRRPDLKIRQGFPFNTNPAEAASDRCDSEYGKSVPFPGKPDPESRQTASAPPARGPDDRDRWASPEEFSPNRASPSPLEEFRPNRASPPEIQTQPRPPGHPDLDRPGARHKARPRSSAPENAKPIAMPPPARQRASVASNGPDRHRSSTSPRQKNRSGAARLTHNFPPSTEFSHPWADEPSTQHRDSPPPGPRGRANRPWTDSKLEARMAVNPHLGPIGGEWRGPTNSTHPISLHCKATQIDPENLPKRANLARFSAEKRLKSIEIGRKSRQKIDFATQTKSASFQ